MSTIESSLEKECSSPLASVVIVTRSRADFLERLLRALRSQSYSNYEVVVVDNDSKDRTAQLVAEFSARHIFVPSGFGIGHCRNRGVEAARGEVIAFCDDDTIPSADWLKHLVRRLVSEKDLGLVGGRVINIGFSGAQQFKGQTKLGRNGKLSFVADPMDADFYGNMNLAFRRDAINIVGNYDPFFNVMAEIDLSTRMRQRGFKVGYEPGAVLEHHHSGIYYKKRHLFFGPQLVRLYFYFKHYRPSKPLDWLSFAGYEARLLIQDLIKWMRAIAATTIRGKFRRISALGIELFNMFSARLAIPWLLWRVHMHKSLNGGKGSRTF